jgi:hypothetical protein
MNKEDERFINNVKKIIKQNYVDDEDDVIGIFIKLINLIQKQDKIIDNYKEMIINHKKQLKQSGIYGYDYDLNIIEKEVEKDEERT